MDLLGKSKSDKQNEENTEGENSGPSRQTEISEIDDHEDDNTENEGPGPSSQTSASCIDERKFSPRKRKMESSISNLEKKIKQSIIETDASRIEKDIIVNEQFPCKYREAKISSIGNLRGHSAHKHKEYHPYTCNECPSPKQFNSSEGLYSHKCRIHRKGMKHECNICGKQFYKKIDFTRHFAKHNNERNFMCDFCSKVFKTRNTCQMHMKIHTRKEEGKYKCDVSGKRFGRNYYMKMHKQKKHPEEDSSRNEQRGHEDTDAQLTTHENERYFVCDFCPKTFKNIQYRNRHMKIHTRKEEDKYECDVCGKRFFYKRNVKRHKQKKHPEGDSSRNEHGQSHEEIDAQLTANLDESALTFRQEQDLQLQKRIDLKQQKNDSQESQRDMLDEKLEHDNDPEMQNFIPHYYHNQNEIIKREQNSQSDNDFKFEHPDNQFIVYDSCSQKESNSPKRIEHSEENIPLNQQDESVGIEMDLERYKNEESRQNKSQYDETEPELYNQPCEDVYQFGNLDLNDVITLCEKQCLVYEQCQNICGSRMENAQPSTSRMKIDKWHKCQICGSQFAQEQDLEVHMELCSYYFHDN